ncbi:hypothetical protein FSP39_016900 [Pinctada imbricata]|uniref:G-protein coupled receptors family 3 profile domain-containing protein n=1 Tax=Pinctada imbricata TaxID=66713 RepID=A0AA88YNJ5_PINIB|nr:hypothetical protein FSP39_016900 [Pinctada imbricata]
MFDLLLSFIFASGSEMLCRGETCLQPSVKADYYTTTEAVASIDTVFVVQFLLTCKNNLRDINLYADIQGKTIPVTKTNKDDSYQISFSDEHKKLPSGTYSIRLFDEEGYAALRKAQRSGENIDSVKPLSTISISHPILTGTNAAMSIGNIYLLSVFTLFGYLSGSKAYFEPEVMYPGDPSTSVLVLFDFHRDISQNGSCYGFVRRSVEKMMAMKWLKEEMANTSGIDLGVIIHSSKEVHETVEAIFRPLGVLLIHLSETEKVSFKQGTSLTLSTVSIWKLQAAVEIISRFKSWESMNVLYSDTAPSITSFRLFSILAVKYSLCIKNSILLYSTDTKVEHLNMSKDEPVIFFNSGDNDVILKSLTSSDHVVMMFNDGTSDVTNDNPNVLRVEEIFSSLDTLVNSVIQSHKDFEVTNEVTKTYFMNLNFCNYNESSLRISCHSNLTDLHFKECLNGRDITSALSAVLSLQQSVQKADVAKCTDFSQCPETVTFHRFPLIQSSIYSARENDTSVVSTGEAVPVLFYFKDQAKRSEVAIWNDSSLYISNETSWKSLMMRFQNENQNSSMSYCHTCTNIPETELGPAYVFIPGDHILFGSFPITKRSSLGVPCGEWSLDGLQMAEAFRYAVQSVKSRYSGAFPNSTIGLLILDSCRQNIVTSLDASYDCHVNISSGVNGHMITIRPSDIAANVVFESTLYHRAMKASRPTFVLSSSGLAVDHIQYDRYMLATTEFLSTYNWTYINLVVSKEHDDGGTIVRFKTLLGAKGICISRTLVVGSNKSLTEDHVEMLSRSKQKSNLFIFLSSAEDTLTVYNLLMQRKNSFSVLTFITYTWNSESFSYPGTIVIKPKEMMDSHVSDHLQNMSANNASLSWWRKYHEDTFRCSLELGNSMLYPRQCRDNMTYSNSMQLSPFSTLTSMAVDSAVLALNMSYKEKCITSTDTCKGVFDSVDVIDHVKKVKVDMNGQSFHYSDRGELIIDLNIYNVQNSNSETKYEKIGGYSSSNQIELGPNEVQFYDTNSSRLSSSVVHQCISWCPECFPCNTSRSEKPDSFVFVPGDLFLGGLFPVHDGGETIATCGALKHRNGIDYIVEAFLYAVTTAKPRYPYLLTNVSLGALAVDTCSEPTKLVQTLLNFESCNSEFSNDIKPQMMSSYIAYGGEDATSMIRSTSKRIDKLIHMIDMNQRGSGNSIESQLYSTYEEGSLRTLIETLVNLNWTYIDVLISDGKHQKAKMIQFMELAINRSVCISQSIDLSEKSFQEVFISLVASKAKVAVIMAEDDDIQNFLASIVTRPIPTKTFVFAERTVLWQDTGISLPLGSVLIDKDAKINKEFRDYFQRIKADRQSELGNQWLSEFVEARDQCTAQGQVCSLRKDIYYESSRTIFSVDFLLHALHHRYMRLCPEGNGICSNFTKAGISLDIEDLLNTKFLYQNDTAVYYPGTEEDHQGTYIVKNFQKNLGYLEVGSSVNGNFFLDHNKVQLFDFNGKPRNMIESKCFSYCKCLGVENERNETSTGNKSELYTEMELVYSSETGSFMSELWILILVAVAAGGAFVTLMFIFYVTYKVCAGLLIKRYIGLGIFLLFSVISLYLSIIPFAFSPSKNVCAARIFVPGVAYTLCFAALTTKLMTLRSYKYIGLGGEISNLNQFLTVLFVSTVQIAVGVQHLVLKDKLHVFKTGSDDIILYACFYDRKELVLNMIYVMCLIVICAFYSISVRKETKNMGEAKLILMCSWICIFVWVAWITVLFVQPRDYVEPALCIGVLTTATLVVLIVFVPKLHRIARLKYDVKKSGMENGAYRIDSDFMFERPYTLPPTTRNSFKYSEKTNPRSLSSFDTSLSY